MVGRKNNRNYCKYVYEVIQFALIWYFFMIVASIVLQKIWNYIE